VHTSWHLFTLALTCSLHTRAAPDNRTFGVPSVRTDLPVPRLRSVANTQCFGDEAGALRAVQPFVFAHLGLEDSDYTQPRTREEVRTAPLRAGWYRASVQPHLAPCAPSRDHCLAGHLDASSTRCVNVRALFC